MKKCENFSASYLLYSQPQTIKHTGMDVCSLDIKMIEFQK